MSALARWIVRQLFPQLSHISRETLAGIPSGRAKIGRVEGWFATIVNIVLFVVKLLLAVSIQSIALMADAFHTLADALSSLIIVVTFGVTEKPADVEHPYGHGRAEYIATLILSILIVVTGVEFIRSSTERVVSPAILHSSLLVIGIVLGTVVIKEMLARLCLRLAELTDSDTLKADAWHHRSDVFSSLAPIASILLANGGRAQWDGILGVGVGFFVIWIGYSVGRNAIDSLLGKPPGPELHETIQSEAQTMEGVIDIHSIVVHSYGIKRFVSLHMEVDENQSQRDSHKLASRLMRSLSQSLGAHVVVHVDPVTARGEKADLVKRGLKELVNLHPGVSSYHDLRLVHGRGRDLILVKLAVEARLSRDERKKIRSILSGTLRKRFPEFDNRIRLISPVHDY
ncbi:MAG: cation diffusion facilitator family transporter [Candidatus Neomarinimicrobiota bacterium]